MNISTILLPAIIIFLLVCTAVKKVNAYNTFTAGASEALPLAFRLFAYVAAMFIILELMNRSGLTNLLCTLSAPVLTPLGIPEELLPLIFIKPFSGSGSLAVLQSVYDQYGADSYLGRCASIIMGTSETVFYISAVYFAGTKVKNTFKPVAIALFGSFLSVIFACVVCRFM